MRLSQQVLGIESHWKFFYRTSKFDCLNLGIFGTKRSFIQSLRPKVRLFGFFTKTSRDVNNECCLQHIKLSRALMMIYVQFICVTYECVRQLTGPIDMLKSHRNRACVLRFESKFIYLTCRPSASFFGNFVWRPPRTPLNITTWSLRHCDTRLSHNCD